MEHKLLIEVSCDLPKPYSKILSEKEFPRGIPLEINFHVTNIGESVFDGGLLKEISANYYSEFGGMKTVTPLELIIDPIQKNQKTIIYTWKTKFQLAGLVWLQCAIEPKNKEDNIKYFQFKEDVLGQSPWRNAYTVVEKEEFEIIRLLGEINSKLDELVRKEN